MVRAHSVRRNDHTGRLGNGSFGGGYWWQDAVSGVKKWHDYKGFACNYLPNVELFWTNVKQASQTIWDPRHVIQYRMRNRFFEWYQRTYSQKASL